MKIDLGEKILQNPKSIEWKNGIMEREREMKIK
jgi:hypothetical protein